MTHKQELVSKPLLEMLNNSVLSLSFKLCLKSNITLNFLTRTGYNSVHSIL